MKLGGSGAARLLTLFGSGVQNRARLYFFLFRGISIAVFTVAMLVCGLSHCLAGMRGEGGGSVEYGKINPPQVNRTSHELSPFTSPNHMIPRKESNVLGEACQTEERTTFSSPLSGLCDKPYLGQQGREKLRFLENMQWGKCEKSKKNFGDD